MTLSWFIGKKSEKLLGWFVCLSLSHKAVFKVRVMRRKGMRIRIENVDYIQEHEK